MKETPREISAGKNLGFTMKKRKRRSGLHTTATTINSCSSSFNKFGSFILLATVDQFSFKSSRGERFTRENSLIMLSSVSESESCSNHDDQLDYFGGFLDQVFKVELDNNNNNLGGGGGGGGGSSKSNDDDQQLQLVLKLKSLGVPPKYESCFIFKTIVGSCNGLVCLYDDDRKEVSLWNPNTRNHRILPKPKNIGEDWSDRLLTFGYDVKTKDYKVVLINGFTSMHYRPVSPIECICRVQVYNLSTDSWRLLKGITCLPGYPFLDQGKVLYLNGGCFFMARFFHTKQQPCLPENDRFIISFDLTKEIVTPIQLPDHHKDQELYLSCLGDEMALFTKSYRNGTRENYNVWVLKDSWTNLYSFQIKLKIPGECNTPVGISNDGEFALLQTMDSTGFGLKMKLFHFASKEVKRNFLSCSVVLSKAFAYKPSRVSIEGGKTAAKEEEAEAAAAGWKNSSSKRRRSRSSSSR